MSRQELVKKLSKYNLNNFTDIMVWDCFLEPKKIETFFELNKYLQDTYVDGEYNISVGVNDNIINLYID